MLTIGEFSISTKLTVKTLRMYHEEGILVPEKNDSITGYRYYGEKNWQKAQVIKTLRDLGFSHKELKDILLECKEDEDLGAFLKKRIEIVDREILRLRQMHDQITICMETGKGNQMKQNHEIIEKIIPRIIICGIRYKGKYNEIGKSFVLLFKKAGRYISGCPMALYYDCEYQEEADIEAVIAVKKEVSIEGIDCRIIPETKVISVFHYGPYETIGESYKLVFNILEERGLKALVPSREVYIKGPGMIFKRDPKNFVTEIQIPIE